VLSQSASTRIVTASNERRSDYSTAIVDRPFPGQHRSNSRPAMSARLEDAEGQLLPAAAEGSVDLDEGIGFTLLGLSQLELGGVEVSVGDEDFEIAGVAS
jgi:hypothetical protein